MLPVRGATSLICAALSLSSAISIHAPRAGSDVVFALHDRPAVRNFNPCSPCGERRRAGRHPRAAAGISIHAPRAGSDLSDPAGGDKKDISIHAPRAGSDPPLGAGQDQDIVISIHAPRAGSDQYGQDAQVYQELFQSMLPVRGATHGLQSSTATDNISIHAPRAGSDGICTPLLAL